MILNSLNHLLHFSQNLTANYALAIIVMTLILRLILIPLQFISMKASKKMQALQPELDLIKVKYEGKPEKLREETMKLFKEKSANPFMGFLPLMLQMPIFFTFYKLISTSPEIIGSAFGWLMDISRPDPLFILPIVAGVIQLAVLLTSNDGSKANHMTRNFKFIMSAVFTFVMLKMPVAVILYTITTSVCAMIEKGVINKIIG